MKLPQFSKAKSPKTQSPNTQAPKVPAPEDIPGSETLGIRSNGAEALTYQKRE
ncbi:hypothetical protein [Pseudophaeobacter arcticus]|uniref:hypothetical protein n=1 Tax=Pseudophaeobacter arcticus TaxID=385492 RepID=UPI003A981315